MTDGPITLQSIARPGLASSLVAQMNDGGELELVGHDIGDAVSAEFGDGEHRFRLTVAVDGIEGLATALHRELHDGHDGPGELLDLLRAAFDTGLFSSAYDFRTWLGRSNIDCRFSSI